MFKIQTLNKISTIGLEQFHFENYEIASEFTAPDAILLRSADMHEMNLSENTKAIARAGAGINNIPIEKCTEKGIVVFNTPGANANAVKELAICGMLLSSRKILQGAEWTKNYSGSDLTGDVEKNKSSFKGPELMGKTLGVIGLGAIGMLTANAAEALGMRVVGFDPYISIDSAWQLSKNVERAISLDALLSQADYLSLHVPLAKNTKEFINADRFRVMKDGVRLINFARGGLVHKGDLIQALDNGKVSCFVTDFPDDALHGHEKVIALPHLGASTPESEDNCAVMAVNQLKDYLENGNIRNSVNFPESVMPRNGGARLIIANKNIPKMVGQITNVLAERDINISDMLNKHHGDLAYNIIDIDGTIATDDIDKIKEIEGVIMVRLIA